jgi:hypothetical protein
MDAHAHVTRAPARTKLLNPLTTALLRLGLRPDPRALLWDLRLHAVEHGAATAAHRAG